MAMATLILAKTLQLLLSLSLLVFIHELGHFLAARLFKVRVERFFLFFDWKFALLRYRSKRTGTLYGIGWLPLGGYCSMAGMVDERFLYKNEKSASQPDEFRAKPAWQRLFIMMAGILFNLLLAMVIYAGITYHWGDESLRSDAITSGMSFSPAAQKAGFRDGDIILSADGLQLDALSPNFMRSVITAQKVTVQRDDKNITIDMPHDMMQQVMAEGVGFMGIQIPFIVEHVIEGKAAAQAGLQAGDKLIAVDGAYVADIVDAQTLMRQEPIQSHTLTLLRGQDTIQRTLSPDKEGMIGVQLRTNITKIYPTEHIQYGFWESIPKGIGKALNTLKSYVKDMQYAFTKEGAKQMGGFISIGKLFPTVFDAYSFWSITALLSVILAFMNFLPIPLLDGAYIFFTLWEIITRKKVSDKALLKANQVGLIILLLLLLYANGNDLIRLFFRY